MILIAIRIVFSMQSCAGHKQDFQSDFDYILYVSAYSHHVLHHTHEHQYSSTVLFKLVEVFSPLDAVSPEIIVNT